MVFSLARGHSLSAHQALIMANLENQKTGNQKYPRDFPFVNFLHMNPLYR